MYSTLDEIAEGLNQSGATFSQPLVGCSANEIQMIEEKYEVTLPRTYRRFLELMGHCAGGMGGQPDALLYPRVLLSTGEERELQHSCNKQRRADYKHALFMLPLRRFMSRLGLGRKPEHPVLTTSDFPSDALVIYMETGLPEFWSIRCQNLKDSPVYRFDYEDEAIDLQQQYPSVVDFFSTLLESRLEWLDGK